MKNLVLLLLLSLNLLAQKKPTDVVDLNNFDYLYAEQLLHDKFNTELSKLYPGYKPFQKDSVAFKAIEYQLNCNISQNKSGHVNETIFRNILLKNSWDRIDFFFNGKKYVGNSIEVLSNYKFPFEVRDTTKKQYYVIDSNYLKEYNYRRFVKTEKCNDNRKYYTYNSIENNFVHRDDSGVLYNDKITYEFIINTIYDGFMIESVLHKNYIISAFKSGYKCFWKIEFRLKNNCIVFNSGSVFL